MKIYCALTNHGFGHASRIAWLIDGLRQHLASSHFIINSSVPNWFFAAILKDGYELRSFPLDVGIIQHDSLQMDLDATRRAYYALVDHHNSGALAREAQYLVDQQVELIIADAPARATDLAALAGIPVFVTANFTWDFIYQDFGGEFSAIAQLEQQAYQRADRYFRYPFYTPMTPEVNWIDVGLPGATPRYPAEELREKLRLDAAIPTTLLTFGGMGVSGIPYGALSQFDGRRLPRRQFITLDQSAPQLDNLKVVTDRDIFPVDLMILCESVVTKPGFGTFSDAYGLGLTLFSLDRQGFAETPYMLQGLRDHFYHRMVSDKQFFSGDWSFLLEPPHAPQSTQRLPASAAERIARAINEL